MRNGRIGFWLPAVARSAAITLTVLGLGLGASAALAEGKISFSSGLTFKGPFVHEPDSDTPSPWVYGQFLPNAQGGRNAGKGTLALKGLLKDGRNIEITIFGPIEKLSKVPQTYKFYTAFGDDIRGKYDDGGTSCDMTNGTLTLTALGAVDGLITGKLSGLEYSKFGCEKAGKSASFSMQRAVDAK